MVNKIFNVVLSLSLFFGISIQKTIPINAQIQMEEINNNPSYIDIISMNALEHELLDIENNIALTRDVDTKFLLSLAIYVLVNGKAILAWTYIGTSYVIHNPELFNKTFAIVDNLSSIDMLIKNNGSRATYDDNKKQIVSYKLPNQECSLAPSGTHYVCLWSVESE